MTIDDSDVIVRLENMPVYLKGFTSVSSDGAYNIYLNSRLTYETMLKTYLHELKHIRYGDFEADKPVAELER